jgi:hypothetical protein
MTTKDVTKIGCQTSHSKRKRGMMWPEQMFAYKAGTLVLIRQRLGLSDELTTRAEIIFGILLHSFEMSEEAAFALLRKQRLFLSAPAVVKVKEALAGMEEEESQEPIADEASQPDSLLVLLPPECLAHIVSFLPTEEVPALPLPTLNSPLSKKAIPRSSLWPQPAVSFLVPFSRIMVPSCVSFLTAFGSCAHVYSSTSLVEAALREALWWSAGCH